MLGLHLANWHAIRTNWKFKFSHKISFGWYWSIIYRNWFDRYLSYMIEISECEGWKRRQRHPKWPYWKIWPRNIDTSQKLSKINISKFFGRKYKILEKSSFEIVEKSKINVKKAKIKIRIKSSWNFNKPRFFTQYWNSS